MQDEVWIFLQKYQSLSFLEKSRNFDVCQGLSTFLVTPITKDKLMKINSSEAQVEDFI